MAFMSNFQGKKPQCWSGETAILIHFEVMKNRTITDQVRRATDKILGNQPFDVFLRGGYPQDWHQIDPRIFRISLAYNPLPIRVFGWYCTIFWTQFFETDC